MMYLYLDHNLGVYYTTRNRKPDEDLECAYCGLSDIRLGTYTTEEEKIQLISTFEKVIGGGI